MKKTLIAAAVLGLVMAAGGPAMARPHHRHHRTPAVHMNHARARNPARVQRNVQARGPAGNFHPSPVQRMLGPMFQYAYHH